MLVSSVETQLERRQRQEIAELKRERSILRHALNWYAETAAAVACDMRKDNQKGVQASVRELALDNGRRGAAAMRYNTALTGRAHDKDSA